MRVTVGILAMLFFMVFSGNVFAAADADSSCARGSADYLVDGLRYRGEGNCQEAVNSYQKARKLGQFQEDWIYDLAVADCLVALKQLDNAIDSYTKVIEGTANRTLQGDMYRGRAFAYYLKAVSPTGMDSKMLALAGKDLDAATNLGIDVSDIRRTIKDESEAGSSETGMKEKTVVESQPVTVIENPGKMIIRDGEYALYISSDTKITDRNGTAVAASDVRPGDLIDFSYTESYRNKADGMVHASAKTITLHREVAPKPEPAPAETKEKPPARDVADILIMSRINMLADEIKELLEKTKSPSKAPMKATAQKKARRKKTSMKKTHPEKNEFQGEIK